MWKAEPLLGLLLLAAPLFAMQRPEAVVREEHKVRPRMTVESAALAGTPAPTETPAPAPAPAAGGGLTPTETPAPTPEAGAVPAAAEGQGASLAGASAPAQAVRPKAKPRGDAPAAEEGLEPLSSQGQAPEVAVQAPEAFVDAVGGTLVAELALLDGGPLSRALERAAARGASLRVLLDPSRRSTRRRGLKLAAAGVRVELRWSKGAGAPLRSLAADRVRLLRWRPGQEGRRMDPGLKAWKRRFDPRWAAAASELPEAQRLEDELESLPDPRETEPQVNEQRRDAAGEE